MIDVDEHPRIVRKGWWPRTNKIGHDRPADREEPETQYEQIVDDAEAFAHVDVARDRLERIEDEWSKR
ncbi:hypothetical protein [Halorubrum sp. DTA98]|uniref:hypothetical protein n=1 Tax=Halorubrum sp. DTA98 TaxID=3402163 RepID=UPI003AAB8612